MQVNQLLA